MDRFKDKAKNISQGGWHSSGDRPIHRESWKSDIKGMATGKKKDPYEYARNHQSAPLSTLKDPDSFGPPPKHRDYYGDSPTTPTSPARPSNNAASAVVSARAPVPPVGGLGDPVPAPRRAQQQEEQKPKGPPVPYRVDTSGLRTDNLPKPPLRKDGAAAPATPPRSGTPQSPSLPARSGQPPAPPQRQQQPPVPPQRQQTLPSLPPRMNEYPDEYTPPPPPSYGEATTRPAAQDPAAISAGAMQRLGQAGVSVPGFGIGSGSASSSPAPASIPQTPATASGHPSQLSELQQRFARMGTNGGESQSSTSTALAANHIAEAVAYKKPPPPPPPKKPGLGGTGDSRSSIAGGAPPPLPLASKPRP